MKAAPRILTLNGGSSSIRFAVFEADASPKRLLDGKVDRIGLTRTTLSVAVPSGSPPVAHSISATSHQSAAAQLLEWLEGQPLVADLQAVGHRVVHGSTHSEPEKVTPKLLAELRLLTPYAPDHLPREVSLMRAVSKRFPEVPQVACFDTAFHRAMPRVAKQLPIPRRYTAKGVERYGFHGISYAYLLEELERLDGAAAKGRVILAHLGNGASVAAVRSGHSMDTSMGFTPAAGLVMGSRSGDLDPGLGYYLARTRGMTPSRFERMVNHESGLLGVSGTSSDVRDLCAREATDVRAADAVRLFCYQARKWIGAFSAVLGGLETLVFSAGIGENSPLIRGRICEGLDFLGVRVDPSRNDANAAVISPDGVPVRVRVIKTDEEGMIAKYVARALNFGSTRI